MGIEERLARLAATAFVPGESPSSRHETPQGFDDYTRRVFVLMADGQWRTGVEIRAAIGGEKYNMGIALRRIAEVSGYTIDRRRVRGDVLVYRMQE